MDFKEYLDKVCKTTEVKTETKASIEQEKKYCEDFVKGEDGYCIYYNKPKPLDGAIKDLMTKAVIKTVNVYEAVTVNCTGQCNK